jgi:hypothetical protein
MKKASPAQRRLKKHVRTYWSKIPPGFTWSTVTGLINLKVIEVRVDNGVMKMRKYANHK